MCSNRQRGSWTELLLCFRIRPFSSTRHHSLIPRTSAVIYKHTRRLLYACPHALFKHTLTHIRTEWKMHAVNFQLALSALFLTILPSLHPIRRYFSPSLLSLTHIHFLHSGSSVVRRCLVNLFKLYGTDTQLVVGALTRPEEKRLGLLQTGAVNRNKMGFTGLQGLSYSQTIQLICQGDPKCSPPSLWFVHASVCLQSSQVINMRRSKIHSAGNHSFYHHLLIWLVLHLRFLKQN